MPEIRFEVVDTEYNKCGSTSVVISYDDVNKVVRRKMEFYANTGKRLHQVVISYDDDEWNEFVIDTTSEELASEELVGVDGQ